MQAYDISTTSLILCFLMLLIPLAISYLLNLDLIKSTFKSISRMTLQLAFIGIFLTFIFDLNNTLLNLFWIMLMLIVASHSVIESCDIKLSKLFTPLFLSFTITNLSVLFYFNNFVIDLTNLFEARYLIPIGGMVLGNSLRANIIGINDFRSEIKRNEHRYLYSLSMGAQKHEALIPYLRKSMISAIKPTIANMSTVGIVFLPGMMTGQILGGSSPIVAIEYQIAIMVAIYVTTVMSVMLSIIVTIYIGFDKLGIFRKDVLKEGNKK
ncbi:MAG: ABC transporter permease [Methanohalobium sp.]|uniref:ABC transporter permease n=1 Tax=Methanohalobium sp. TaxID=2837493 RepID=UPI00397A6AAF